MEAHERFKANQKTIELDGLSHLTLRVAYTDVGEGEPVILLHGIPTWSFFIPRSNTDTGPRVPGVGSGSPGPRLLRSSRPLRPLIEGSKLP